MTETPDPHPTGAARDAEYLDPPTTQMPRVTTSQERRDIRRLLRGSLYSGLRPRTEAGRYSVQDVMGFSLDLAEEMLLSGATSREMEVAVIAVASTWALAPLEIETTAAAVRLQYSPRDAAPITEMRVVRGTRDDHFRLSEIHRLVDDVVAGAAGLHAASSRLAALSRLGSRWPATAQVLSMGALGSTLNFLAGGNGRSAVLAFLLTVLVVALGRAVARTWLPGFYVVALQSATVLGLGVAALAAGLVDAGETAASTAACLVLLLPHPQIVVWAQDAITGFRDPANARGLSIALTLLGVLLGVPVGLAVAAGSHVVVDPTRIVLVSPPLLWALVVAVVAAAANGVAQGASASSLLPIAAMAVLAALAQRGFLALGLGAVFSAFAAAAVLGALSTVAAALRRTSMSVLAVPAFCGALLPALAVANSLLGLVAGTDDAGLQFATALLTTLGIGAGLVLGNVVCIPWMRRLTSA